MRTVLTLTVLLALAGRAAGDGADSQTDATCAADRAASARGCSGTCCQATIIRPSATETTVYHLKHGRAHSVAAQLSRKLAASPCGTSVILLPTSADKDLVTICPCGHAAAIKKAVEACDVPAQYAMKIEVFELGENGKTVPISGPILLIGDQGHQQNTEVCVSATQKLRLSTRLSVEPLLRGAVGQCFCDPSAADAACKCSGAACSGTQCAGPVCSCGGAACCSGKQCGKSCPACCASRAASGCAPGCKGACCPECKCSQVGGSAAAQGRCGGCSATNAIHSERAAQTLSKLFDEYVEKLQKEFKVESRCELGQKLQEQGSSLEGLFIEFKNRLMADETARRQAKNDHAEEGAGGDDCDFNAGEVTPASGSSTAPAERATGESVPPAPAPQAEEATQSRAQGSYEPDADAPPQVPTIWRIPGLDQLFALGQRIAGSAAPTCEGAATSCPGHATFSNPNVDEADGSCPGACPTQGETTVALGEPAPCETAEAGTCGSADCQNGICGVAGSSMAASGTGTCGGQCHEPPALLTVSPDQNPLSKGSTSGLLPWQARIGGLYARRRLSELFQPSCPNPLTGLRCLSSSQLSFDDAHGAHVHGMIMIETPEGVRIYEGVGGPARDHGAAAACANCREEFRTFLEELFRAPEVGEDVTQTSASEAPPAATQALQNFPAVKPSKLQTTSISYSLRDLVLLDEQGRPVFDPCAIIDHIMAAVAPESWSHPSVSIQLDQQTVSLLVRQTPEVHRQIQAHLEHLRTLQVKQLCGLIERLSGGSKEATPAFGSSQAGPSADRSSNMPTGPAR